MRLRATSMAEANWVSSPISAARSQEAGGSGGDDSIARAQSGGTVVRGLIAPNLQRADEQTGGHGRSSLCPTASSR